MLCSVNIKKVFSRDIPSYSISSVHLSNDLSLKITLIKKMGWEYRNNLLWIFHVNIVTDIICKKGDLDNVIIYHSYCNKYISQNLHYLSWWNKLCSIMEKSEMFWLVHLLAGNSSGKFKKIITNSDRNILRNTIKINSA